MIFKYTAYNTPDESFNKFARFLPTALFTIHPKKSPKRIVDDIRHHMEKIRSYEGEKKRNHQ